jgi:hypothetical protein
MNCCWSSPIALLPGIMLFRKNSADFVNEWIDIIEKDDQVWDQNAFNDLYRRQVVVVYIIVGSLVLVSYKVVWPCCASEIELSRPLWFIFACFCGSLKLA